MSFGMALALAMSSPSSRGMLIYDKINNRNEPVIEITTSLQRYLKPLKGFLETRNGLARQ
jgi:hypothetical protein